MAKLIVTIIEKENGIGVQFDTSVENAKPREVFLVAKFEDIIRENLFQTVKQEEE